MRGGSLRRAGGARGRRMALVAVAALAVVAIAVGASRAPPSTQTAAPRRTRARPRPHRPPRRRERGCAPAGAVPSGCRHARRGTPRARGRGRARGLRVPSVALELGVVPVGVHQGAQSDVPTRRGRLVPLRPRARRRRRLAVLACPPRRADVGAAPMQQCCAPRATDRDHHRVGRRARLPASRPRRVCKGGRLDALFARDGEHVVRLVTCGGEWDADRRGLRQHRGHRRPGRAVSRVTRWIRSGRGGRGCDRRRAPARLRRPTPSPRCCARPTSAGPAWSTRSPAAQWRRTTPRM